MRMRHHVNPLTAGLNSYDGRRLKLELGVPVELEVGCADAQFLFERARADGRRRYVGVEVRSYLVDEVNAQAEAEGLPITAVFCNANHHLLELLPARSIDRIYLNFPDPWFKKKHRKRRMINPALARDLAELAKPGADVFIQSDVWGVALDAMDAFERSDDLFTNRAGAWTFWRDGNPYGARSWREQHCEQHDLPIWRIRYDRGRT